MKLILGVLLGGITGVYTVLTCNAPTPTNPNHMPDYMLAAVFCWLVTVVVVAFQVLEKWDNKE